MDPTVQETLSLLFQVGMGVSLAACAGLRAFLPMFVAGVAGRFELIPLAGPFEWMSGTPALVVLGVAVVAELLGDKIPAVDNFLDGLQTFVKPVAGTILVVSVVTELPVLYSTVLGLIAGGGTAAAVHVTKANTRLASTAATVGLANPLISFVEDAFALVGSLISLFFPFVVLGGLVVAVVVVWRLLRRDPAAPAGAG